MNNIKEIAGLLAETHQKKLIQEFLESLFTPAELEAISSRWEIVKRLDKGISQRKIAKELHLSLCKITRGSKELKKVNSPMKKMISKIDIDKTDK
ncbi:MAG: transcriptional regulator [Calditrichaceae bacterium]|nr:transcriptional regulator [Calditrichaceae bacterium]